MKATLSRPSLARILIDAGYDLLPVRSVWDPSRYEWEFYMDEAAAQIITDYYAKLGKRPPLIVKKFMEVYHHA